MDEFSKGFTSNPDLVFHDISNEEYRTYYYPIGEPGVYTIVKINNPVAVCWKDSPRISGGGSHRVVDADGACFYLPAGWVCIKWEKKEKDGVVPYEF